MCRVGDCTSVVLREEISSSVKKKTWKVGKKSPVTQMEVWALKSSRRTQLGCLQTHLPKEEAREHQVFRGQWGQRSWVHSPQDLGTNKSPQ